MVAVGSWRCARACGVHRLARILKCSLGDGIKAKAFTAVNVFIDLNGHNEI